MAKDVPSPMVTSKVAPVLMPTPGSDIRSFERGWASSRAAIWASRVRRWSRTAASCRASEGTMVAAAFVPGRHDALFVEGGEDVVHQALVHPGRQRAQTLDELPASGFSDLGGDP